MNLRIAALCGALAFALTACPSGNNDNDGGTTLPDGGTLPVGGCANPCGPNQVCDEQTHTCVPGCNPACLVGDICVNNNGIYTCQHPQSTCGDQTCEAGQSACVAGNCSCLDFNQTARDTCAASGKVCHQSFNPVSMNGGSCENPKQYEYCDPDCTGPECGSCPTGTKCDTGLFGSFGICARTCSQDKPTCGADEFCGGSVCYPKSLFSSNDPNAVNPFGCKTYGADGGIEGTYPSTTCIKISATGALEKEETPSGTCTYAVMKSDTQPYFFTYCRSPGPVPEFGACKTDVMPVDLGNTCGTGLECMPTGTGNDGICLRACNARPNGDGSPGAPSCNADESCVNIYRQDLLNGQMGVCMKSCNVFSGTAPTFGCAPLGTTQSACIPSTPEGAERLSLQGSGFCAPVVGTAQAEGQPCELADPMKGASCQSGLICVQSSGDAQAKCTRPCDVACSGGDGGVPARCSTESNATCGAGKTCTRVNGATGAFTGLCL